METKFVLSCFIALSLTSSLLAETSSVGSGSDNAAETSSSATALGKEIKDLTHVLESGEFVQQAPKLNAKYYLVLSSSSRCGPCRAEMPNIVKEYKRFKNNSSVELIHLSADKTKEDALKWAKEVRAPFPIILHGTGNIPKALTQKKSGGIPHLIIINSEGKLIAEGHPGTLMKEYKKIIAKDNGGSFPK